jgi:hypothetical protein
VNSFVLAYVGGIVGAVLMDITETLAARAGLTSGVSVALVGRWALGLLRGQLRPCRHRPRRRHGRARCAWAGRSTSRWSAVAASHLLYAAVSAGRGATCTSPSTSWGGSLFGVATSLLPWLLLLPAFGWGWFGRRGPRGSNAVLASTLSHMPYGLGVGRHVMALRPRATLRTVR